MISWRVISPDPSYSGVFCYSGSEKSTIYKKNVSSVYYIFIPGNETMWHKCWCQAFNAALDLFSLDLFLGVSCIFHKIIRKFWKPLQDSRKGTMWRSPEWKDVGSASLIPTYSVFKSLHGALKTILGIEILVAFSLKSAFKNIPGKTSSWTKTRLQTLKICIFSLMRLLRMCPWTSFRRLG